MIAVFGIAVIGVGVLLDIASLVLGLRRLRGDGPSGVPIYGLILYVTGVAVLAFGRVLPMLHAVTALALLMVLHASCQYVILAICDKLIPK